MNLLTERILEANWSERVFTERQLARLLDGTPQRRYNLNPAVDALWLENALTARIQVIDWTQAARDVAPFLSTAEQHSLKLWSPRFFTDKAGKLARAMTSRLF
jgi:hypothetical protein